MELTKLKTTPVEGPVEIDANVRNALNRSWEGLQRIEIHRFENGRQEQLGVVELENEDDPEATPEDNPEEVLAAIYQVGAGRSLTLERQIQCRAKFVRAKPLKATSAIFRPEAPDLAEYQAGTEEQREITALEADAVGAPGVAAMGLAMYRATKLMVDTTIRAQEMQAQMLADANERLNSMLDRQSTLVHEIASSDREAATERALNKAVEQLLKNTEIHHELRTREALLELEKFKTVQKAKSSSRTMEMLAEHLPMLGAVAFAKMTGQNPAELVAAISGAKIAAPPAQTGAPPPPPPLPGSSPPAAAPAKAPPQPTASESSGLSRFMELTRQLGSTLTPPQLAKIEAAAGREAREALESWVRATDEGAALFGMRNTAGAPGLLDALEEVCTDEQKVLVLEALEAVKESATPAPPKPKRTRTSRKKG